MLCVDLEVSRLGQLFFGEPLARNIDIYAFHIGIHFPLLFYLSEFESSVLVPFSSESELFAVSWVDVVSSFESDSSDEDVSLIDVVEVEKLLENE